MKRRTMIRQLVLGSSILLSPGLIISGKSKQVSYLVTIGTIGHTFIDDYLEANPETPVLRFNSNENITAISSIIPKGVKVIIISTLFKQETILSLTILRFLQNLNMDYRYLAITPLLNPIAGRNAMPLLNDYNNNPRVIIFDVNEYFRRLSLTNNKLLATDAFEQVNEVLMEWLEMGMK